MSNVKYYKIFDDDISPQKTSSTIKNFIVSDNSTNTGNHKLNIRYLHLVEGTTFAVCSKGSARLKINMHEYQVTENTLITLIPGYLVELLSRSEDICIDFLFFTFDFIADIKLTIEMDIFAKTAQMPCLKLTGEETKNLLQFHTFIAKQYKKTDHLYRKIIAKNLLYTFICEVAQLYHGTKVENNSQVMSRQERIIKEFLELLFKHHKQERSVAFYAQKMFLSPKYLSKLVKDATSKSVLQWIDQIVIMAAKGLLKTSDLTVLQISEELNFANASFFGSFFRKRVGVTPMRYREE